MTFVTRSLIWCCVKHYFDSYKSYQCWQTPFCCIQVFVLFAQHLLILWPHHWQWPCIIFIRPKTTSHPLCEKNTLIETSKKHRFSWASAAAEADENLCFLQLCGFSCVLSLVGLKRGCCVSFSCWLYIWVYFVNQFNVIVCEWILTLVVYFPLILKISRTEVSSRSETSIFLWTRNKSMVEFKT